MLTVIIMRVDLIKSLKPNSLHKTIKVAIQGKDIANKVAAINICLAESPKGISIPTATSFLKNPIAKAIAAMIHQRLARRTQPLR